MATVNEKMTALANIIRKKTGVTEQLSISGMINALEGMNVGVSTCTVTFPQASVSDLMITGNIYYIGEGSMGPAIYSISLSQVLENSVPLTVIKPSILVLDGSTYGSLVSTHQNIQELGNNYSPYRPFIINGDCSFSISDNAPV